MNARMLVCQAFPRLADRIMVNQTRSREDRVENKNNITDGSHEE